LKVGLIAERFSRTSGVGPERYSYELLTHLRAMHADVTTVASDPLRQRFGLAINSFSRLPVKTLGVLRGVDILHATDPSSAVVFPLTGKKSVVTFHDLASLLHMGQFGSGDRVFAKLVLRMTANPSKIIAVSEQTKAELVARLNVPPEKINVVNLGVSESFHVITNIRKDAETIGYVGDLNQRKRVDFLIRGFAVLKAKRPHAKLVIVGSGVESANLRSLVQKLGVRDVDFVGKVGEEKLAELYNSMTVLVLPSDYEGFGLPIIEAQSCGTPVVIRSDARISPEVARACVKVSSEESLALELEVLLTEKKMYSMIKEDGLRIAGSFTWGRCATETLKTYTEVLGE
jgi:glycosyltransferase involved in cell wall biosynthesis